MNSILNAKTASGKHTAPPTTGDESYKVASCFSQPIQRLDAAQLPSYWNYDESTGNCTGITDRGALYTFEEFLDERSASHQSNEESCENSDPVSTNMTSIELATISATITEEMLNLGEPPPTITTITTTTTTTTTTSVKQFQSSKKQQQFVQKQSQHQHQQTKQELSVNSKSTNGAQHFKMFCRSKQVNETKTKTAVESSSKEQKNDIDDGNLQETTSSMLFRRTFFSTARSDIHSAEHSGDDKSTYGYSNNKDNVKHENRIVSAMTTALPPKFSFQSAFSDASESDEPAERPEQATTATVRAPDEVIAQTCRRRCGESAVSALISKIMCCFRATANVVDLKRHRRYAINTSAQPQANRNNSNNNSNNNVALKIIVEQPGKYSWNRAQDNDIDDEICNIRNCKDQLLMRKPDQIKGQHITIDNCIGCVIVVLDNSASVNIDDCQECLIVLGPCKGSVFIRDCSHSAFYVICQQFRARDCRHLSVKLFSATAPTIEDSNIEFGPLTICYNRIEEHMTNAELSPLVNKWFRVHNFTPESTSFTLMEPCATHMEEDEENLVPNFPLNKRFHDEFLSVPQINSFKLTLKPSVSFFFRVPHGMECALRHGEEKVILLVKSFAQKVNVKNPPELYHDVRRLLKRLLMMDDNYAVDSINESNDARIRLIGLYDMNMKPGELENLLQLKPSKNPGGKLVVIELTGAASFIRDFCAQTLASVGNPPTVEMIEAGKTQFAVHQLAQFSETQSHI